MKEKIIDAAIKEFKQKGLKFTMSDVAKRLSISKKNRATGEYEQDFSGFVMFVGTACAKKAAALKFSMGRITLPHQLARLVLTEQIYRAFTIQHGVKYHK